MIQLIRSFKTHPWHLSYQGEALAEYIEKNKDKLVKLASAVLYANSLMTNDEKTLKQAAEIFSKCFEGFKPQDCIDGSKNVRYVTLGDQINYFGLNRTLNTSYSDYKYNINNPSVLINDEITYYKSNEVDNKENSGYVIYSKNVEKTYPSNTYFNTIKYFGGDT